MITAEVETQFTNALPTDSVDLSVLTSFDDPELGGEPDLIVELIDLYQEEAGKLVETIRTGLQNNDWPMVKRAAHSLRGSSSNLGILQMALISDDLEHLQFLDSSAAEPYLNNLEQELVRVNVILNTERDRRTA
jgi:HPt (histidine-containing phosphotransfer) domain-containing protein